MTGAAKKEIHCRYHDQEEATVGNDLATNLEQNKNQKAVDVVCDRTIFRVVKARCAPEEWKKGSKVPNLRLPGHQRVIEKSEGNRMLEAYHKGLCQHSAA